MCICAFITLKIVSWNSIGYARKTVTLLYNPFIEIIVINVFYLKKKKTKLHNYFSNFKLK